MALPNFHQLNEVLNMHFGKWLRSALNVVVGGRLKVLKHFLPLIIGQLSRLKPLAHDTLDRVMEELTDWVKGLGGYASAASAIGFDGFRG